MEGSEIKNEQPKGPEWTIQKTQCRRSYKMKVYGPEIKKEYSLLNGNLTAFRDKNRRSVKFGIAFIIY